MSAIDRDVVIKKYINPDIEKFHNSDVKIVLENLKQNILKMPSVDEPQAEWIELYRDGFGNLICMCSKCAYHAKKSRYCPFCGKRMKGIEDDTIWLRQERS